MTRVVLLIALHLFTTVVTRGQELSSPYSGEYYCRYVIRPEGEVQGRLFKLSILKDNMVSPFLLFLYYDDYGDYISFENVPGPPDESITSQMNDWEYFDLYGNVADSLLIEKGYIIGDSLFFKRAYLRELIEKPFWEETHNYYDFRGKIEDGVIKGTMTGEYFIYQRADPTSDEYTYTSHWTWSFDVIFKRKSE